MKRRFVRPTLVVVVVGVLMAACGTDDPSQGGRLRVVATTTQVGSIAAEVGGDAIDLTVLLRPGVEAHDFELTPAAGAALEQADLVLLSGLGLEDWLQETLETLGVDDRVRDLSEGVTPRIPSHDDPDHGHEGEDPPAESDAHDDDGHAGEIDPHYWLSGPNAVVMVENASDALAEAAPDHADAFASRAAGLIERLGAADEEVRRLIDEVPSERRGIVTDHDALGYFVDEYGLRFVGSIFPSLDVSSEPSAREIEALVAEIRDQGVAAIFTESSVDPQLARAVAQETDARLVEDPIYTDSLGAPGSGADSLDGMLVTNARVIRDGLLGD